LLAARGTIVSHENVRQWALKFGQELRQPDPAEVALRPPSTDEYRPAILEIPSPSLTPRGRSTL
jgi:hypothetical protein